VTSDTLILAAMAAIFLVLSIFQAALNTLSDLALARLREGGRRRLTGWLLRDATEAPPSRLRVSVQVGRQLCLVGAAVVAAQLAEEIGWQRPLLASFLAVALLFVLIEQLGARAIALIDPERALLITLPAAGLVHYPLLPLSWPLYQVLLWVRRRFPLNEEMEEPAEEDVKAYLAVGEDEGILEQEEGSLIESVIDFSGTLVREVMTPRTEMAAIPESSTIRDLVAFVAKVRHSRIPVYRGSIDHVVGFVNTRDIFEHWGREAAPSVASLVRPVHVVPETKNISDLLRELQASRQQLAIAIDEYGGTAGLVTIEDLLEEIVGEIRDEHEPEDATTEQDGSRIVRGRLDVVRAGEMFGVDLQGEGFETIGGLVEARLGHIPEVGESVVWRGIRFEVTDVDRRRIRRVRMERAPQAVPGGGAAGRTS
jgi:putative hemolysin